MTQAPSRDFVLGLAIWLAFACFLGAVAPRFLFVLQHEHDFLPPPGMWDYRLAATPGAEFYRANDARGQRKTYMRVRAP